MLKKNEKVYQKAGETKTFLITLKTRKAKLIEQILWH